MALESINGSWEQTIAYLLEATEPVNGSWLQAIANALANLPTPSDAGLISTIAANYTALIATTGATAGDFAYVEGAQGAQWLPGSLGGTYYGAGLYYYTGAAWTDALPPIENQLYLDTNSINGKLDLTGGTISGNLIVNNGLTASTGVFSTALKYTGANLVAGNVLTTDADGNATWQAPATLGAYTFYFNNTPSDIATYYDAPITPQIDTISTISNAGVVNNQLLVTFASLPNYPNLTRVPSGNIELHIHGANTNSGKNTNIYFRLYTRTTGGTETLIGTSSNSLTLPVVNGEVVTDIPTTGFTLSASDRIITKVYASVTGGGTAPNISLYLEDGTGSRVSLPAEVTNTANFVPYSGATTNVNLGSNNLTSNGLFTSTLRISSLGGGSSIVSLGLDSSGNVVSASTVSPITEVVYFNSADPNLTGTTFDPNTPLLINTLYVSQVNSTSWTSNGVSYNTYTGTSVSNTPFTYAGTQIDAGSNKSAAISRSGNTYVGYSTALTSTVRFAVVTTGGTPVFKVSENGGIAEGYNTTASATVAHAEGYITTASGLYSHSEGQNTIATNVGSHAEGLYSRAQGIGSHSEGSGTTAYGDYSHAEGANTRATGSTAHAEGTSSFAYGTASHAEGSVTTASGNYSHSEGSVTTASGNASHSEGTSTIASAASSHVEGQNSLASGVVSHAEGYASTASGTLTSHAEGYQSTASGSISHAEGQNGTASGTGSHAEGGFTISSNNYTHAEGYASIASGVTSHAEGFTTVAGGVYSHSQGQATKATGNVSHSEGFATTASGVYSHAEGQSTIASGNTSHAEGYLTTASDYSHSEGFNTKATSSYSHAEGNASIASGQGSHAEGTQSTASGVGAHSEGFLSIASGQGAHSEGQSTTASGIASHAEGGYFEVVGEDTYYTGNTAFGIASHVGGIGSIASGMTSFVHGQNSLATGISTIVLGNNITGATNNTVYVNSIIPSNGATGSFTAGTKVITVTNGIITSIV